jgi:tRNA(Ile)-lysidine synthase
MASSRKSNSDLTARVERALSPFVSADQTVLLGLSGGVDSVVLLHVLHLLSAQQGWRLRALHVHHGISANADGWAAFCETLCAKLNVPLEVVRVDIAPMRAMGIEAAARTLRYQALTAVGAESIVLAQHRDDQAETLLLQLLRGGGVRGAAAMPMRTVLSDRSQLLRPLLDTSRAELLAYAETHGLRWVEDESNADPAYARNFVRHRIFPLLETHYPGCRATLARSAGHFAEAAFLQDALAEIDSADAITAGTLAVERLRALDWVRAKNLLRYFIEQQGAPLPDAPKLEELLRQLLLARQDAQVCVAYAGYAVRRYRERVYVEKTLPECGEDFSRSWSGEPSLAMPELGGVLTMEQMSGRGVACAKLAGRGLTVRLRSGEVPFKPGNNRPARSLKNLFQEAAIPPWRRARWPLLYCGETLVAIPGLGVAADWQSQPGETGWLPTWKRS